MVEILQQKVPGLIRNYVSLVGLIVIALCLANLLFLVLVDLFAGGSNPYFGVLTYMVLPFFLVIGIVLLIVGMLRERARRRKMAPDEVPSYTKIDLNVPRQRAIFIAAGSFLLVFVLLTAVGSYQAYEFTDSTQFCGQL